MSGLLITVEIRSVYGRDTIYPVDDAAKAFASIAGTTTLTVPVLKQIMALGYEVKYQVPRSHLFKAKNGATQFMPSASEIQGVVEGNNMDGYCLACGSVQGGVEPDARRYVCEGCGAAKVYGAQELLIMGLVYDDEAAA